ncbi:MAG: RecQ family ATP-dependent DNA helicase [Dehalococcoidia bacterium]
MFTSDLDAYRTILDERFGYPDFREGQPEVLSQLAHSDVLAVMPTGRGKSMCYVLPALAAGRTVVVSPLIALMQDQVESLQASGIAAAFINSNLTLAQRNNTYLDFVRGQLDLLYVSPEGLGNERFVSGLARAGVNLLAIDEAHCVSEWGHDFRPDYLSLGSVRERLGSPRTLALTATAEPMVRQDIVERLGLKGRAAIVATSVDRPNLKFSVEHIAAIDDRKAWLQDYLSARRGQSGIIYARSRRAVDDIAETLQASGIKAAAYHAGMDRQVRSTVQRRFALDEVHVIVATTAFGMGVNKLDVRFVVHFNMPGRIESYYQEAGRAGRDGDTAECTLLYGPRDSTFQQFFIDRAHPDDQTVRATWMRLAADHIDSGDGTFLMPAFDRAGEDGYASTLTALRSSGLVDASGKRLMSLDPRAPIDTTNISGHRKYAEERLRQMVEYAESSSCRRAAILRYFGEDAKDSCDNCDLCLHRGSPSTSAYPTDLHDSILDLRRRLAQLFKRAPHDLFDAKTARDLATHRPRNNDELLQTWGIGDVKAEWFGDHILDLIRQWEHDHPGAQERIAPSAGRAFRPSGTSADEDVLDDPLYQRLREWRVTRAHSDDVPAFTIFSNRTLRELVARRPSDIRQLSGVWGLGSAKVKKFGRDILAVIRDD